MVYVECVSCRMCGGGGGRWGLHQRIEISVFCTEWKNACFQKNLLVALLHHYE